MTTLPLESYIDHTLLKPEATEAQIKTLCSEAKQFNFKTVCVNPQFVALAAKELKNTEVGVCTVIGFPLGASTSETKAFETQDAIKSGATEIDMVISIGNLISRNDSIVLRDIEAVVKAAGKTPVKVILETALLTQDQIAKACQLCTDAKASFVKTSTGFSTRGASIDDIVIMKANISSEMKIKASGGIRTKEDALKYIDAGVDRLGTSAGKEIIKGEVSSKDY